jgi:endoribonuclease Dicer
MLLLNEALNPLIESRDSISPFFTFDGELEGHQTFVSKNTTGLIAAAIVLPKPIHNFNIRSVVKLNSTSKAYSVSTTFTPKEDETAYKGFLPTKKSTLNPPSNMSAQSVDKPRVEESKILDMASPVNPVHTFSTSKAYDIPTLLSLGQQSTTTLPTRTTEDVIAELRRSIGHHQADLEEPNIHVDSKLFPEYADEANSEDNDEDDDVPVVPLSKQRKITERKRRLNAVADVFLQERNEKWIKEGSKVRPEDEAKQSARWLVNQQENRQIISTPREYQIELFEKAKEKNIVAVLDTGSGKTLIAVLLLRHVFAQELEDRALGKPCRISFFLVDSVQLVFQQHAVLKANLDQPMNMFCGEMGCDLWKKETWDKHFAENMVIVCTAEVLRQCLHHSFISMDQINLLIFDEAHHAKKDHTYARIIKDFYAQQEKHHLRPKIFGMTASPVDARVDVRKAASELEGILHCEIATAADTSLLRYSISPNQEYIRIYAPLKSPFETDLLKLMEAKFKSNCVLKKPLNFARAATRELGAWCADEIWRFCLSEEETKKLMAKTERKYHAKKIPGPLHLLEEHKAQLKEAQDIVKAWDFNPPKASMLSSKVRRLVSDLNDRFERPTDDKCIVFVQQRYTARLLAKLLSHENGKIAHLRVGTLVGDFSSCYRKLINS